MPTIVLYYYISIKGIGTVKPNETVEPNNARRVAAGGTQLVASRVLPYRVMGVGVPSITSYSLRGGSSPFGV